jgi:hypothetical protein
MRERLEMLAREGEEERKQRKGNGMIDAGKLQYFTMAAWMRGYASGLDEYEQKVLIFKLNKAADMLDAVFGKYQEEIQESEDDT